MESKELEDFNDGYYHEIMDRLHVIASMTQDFLTTHPAALKHPDITKKIEQAQKLLGDAYQDFGQFC